MEHFKLSSQSFAEVAARSAEVAAGYAYIKQLDKQEEEERAKKAKEYLEEIFAEDVSGEKSGKYNHAVG